MFEIDEVVIDNETKQVGVVTMVYGDKVEVIFPFEGGAKIMDKDEISKYKKLSPNK